MMPRSSGSWRFLFGLALVVAACRPAPSRGDGGELRAWRQEGRSEVAIFTEPTPVVVGPVDLSVLLLDRTTGAPIRNARISVAVSPVNYPDRRQTHLATEQAATNKLMHAAVFDLPSEGQYAVSATIAGPGDPTVVRFTLDVGPSWPALGGIWPWILWPILPVILYAIHLCLIRLGKRKARAIGRKILMG